MLTIGSLFSGIGGLELGLERSGLGRVVWQVEIDPFARSVLAKHWPEAVRYEDVRSVGKATLAPVDVVCGGFPCQDVSLAGKRAGLSGERSGLWFEFRRIIEELAPSIVVIENVLGLRTAGLSRVLADLTDLGFDAEWSDLSAADVGAPHLRRRLFLAATHAERIVVREQSGWLERACREAAAESFDDGEGWQAADASGIGQSRDRPSVRRTPDEHRGGVAAGGRNREWWPPVSPIRRVDDGIPNRSHGRRLKALGNAVVPQCAEVIGRAILNATQLRTVRG